MVFIAKPFGPEQALFVKNITKMCYDRYHNYSRKGENIIFVKLIKIIFLAGIFSSYCTLLFFGALNFVQGDNKVIKNGIPHRKPTDITIIVELS